MTVPKVGLMPLGRDKGQREEWLRQAEVVLAVLTGEDQEDQAEERERIASAIRACHEVLSPGWYANHPIKKRVR